MERDKEGRLISFSLNIWFWAAWGFIVLFLICVLLSTSGCRTKAMKAEETGGPIVEKNGNHISYLVEIDGHKYIIVDNFYLHDPHGVAIIHAESCSCRSR